MTVAGAWSGGRIRVATDIAEFGAVWPAMQGSPDSSALPFQSRDFISLWTRTIGAARRIETYFVQVDDAAGQPLLLLPLSIQKRRGVRILGVIDGGVSDYIQPVLFEGAAALDERQMRDIWRGVLDALPGVDVVHIDKIPNAIGAVANPLRFLATEAARVSGHALALSGTHDDYRQHRLPRRQDARRKRKRLLQAGPLEMMIPTTVEDRANVVATLIRQKRDRYLATRGVDGFKAPGLLDYVEGLSDLAAKTPAVHLSALVSNGTMIATHLGMVSGDRFYYLMPAFEAGEWQRHSPGRLHIEFMIEWSYANDLAYFDFGVGDEPYKLEFRDELVPLSQSLEPRTALGHAYAQWLRVRNGMADGLAGKYVRSARLALHRFARPQPVPGLDREADG